MFSIPGSIHSPLSKGCHRLLREGAKLVERATDVLEELGLAVARTSDAPASNAGEEGIGSQRAVVRALGGDPCDLDTLIERTRLAADAVAATLVELELDGQVAALLGGRWQRVA